ncbi:hypothetical protein BJX61DRAFT_57006 [Aspergillus egyptiacus]|nr:hypothetical protein BJX61DRAFT_57006 [Aspergillus egyptiacus]
MILLPRTLALVSISPGTYSIPTVKGREMDRSDASIKGQLHNTGTRTEHRSQEFGNVTLFNSSEQ